MKFSDTIVATNNCPLSSICMSILGIGRESMESTAKNGGANTRLNLKFPPTLSTQPSKKCPLAGLEKLIGKNVMKKAPRKAILNSKMTK